MLGILYNYPGARGPELHILNPWSLINSQQSKDVYVLIDTVLKKHARNVVVVDVAHEIQTRQGKTINLQEDEKVGFCTLWVGILAGRIIPDLPKLQMELGKQGSGQLSGPALQIYDRVYTNLQKDLSTMVKASRQTYGEAVSTPTAATAMAVTELAKAAFLQAKLGGKRKSKLQTRRRLFRPRKWTRKHRSPR